MGELQVDLEDVLIYIERHKDDQVALRKIRLLSSKLEQAIKDKKKENRITKLACNEAMQIATMLQGYILELYPHYENTIKLDNWALDIEFIARKYKKIADYNTISALVTWLFTFDSSDARFWRKNVRSVGNLQKHFLRLYDAAKNDLQESEIIEV